MTPRASSVLPLLLASCAAHPPETRPTAAAAPSTTSPPLASTPGLARDVLGWAVLADAAPLARAVAGVAGPALPPPDEATLRVVVARLAGLDAHATDGLDLARPIAIALVRPDVAAEAGGATQPPPPILLALPVRGRAELLGGLAAAHLPVEARPFGAVIATDRGPLAIAVRDADRYAVLAFRPALLEPGWAVLRDLLARRAEAPLAVHVEMEHVQAAFGDQLAGLVERFAEATRTGRDPQAVYALRGARRFVRFAGSLRGLDLLVAADERGLAVVARADGRDGGLFADYIASQQTGPLWGLQLLPPDAVLVYATHRGRATAHAEAEAVADLLGDAQAPPAPIADRAAFRDAIDRVGDELSPAGDFAWALWPARAGAGDAGAGGIGAGGAFRVRPGPGARRATLDAWKRLGDAMGRVAAAGLGLDPARFPLRVSVHPDAARVGGVPIDEVRVAIRWPSGPAGERRVFQALFGPALTLSVAFVGEQAVFALGRDGRARLAAMIAAARGRPVERSIADDARLAAVAGAGADEGRVSLSWVPARAMARFLGDLHRAVHAGDASDPTGAAPDLAPTDGSEGAFTAATSARGGRYELRTVVPRGAFAGVPRVGTILWRMTLSPLLNPPAVPPLPLPPAHVAPGAPGESAPAENRAGEPSRKL